MSKFRLSARYSLLTAFIFCAVFTGIFALLSSTKSLVPGRLERFTTGVVGTIAALMTTAVFVPLAKTSFRTIGLNFQRGSLGRFALGVLIGLGITVAMFSCLLFFGKLELVPQPPFDVGIFLMWTLAFIPLAYMEELAFRAYPLLILERGVGIWPSLLISSLLFALYHIANGWSIPISFLGPGVWGLVFGLAALKSGGIAMPTGIHYATNLTQAALGMSTGMPALWKMQPPDGKAPSETAEIIGLAIQLALLLAVIVAIERYRRTRINTSREPL